MAQVIRRWVEDQKFLFIMRVMFVPSLGGKGAARRVQGE